MEEEAKISKINGLKILNQWRKIMRIAKTESLKNDVEILSKNHEIDVSKKDAILQMLDRCACIISYEFVYADRRRSILNQWSILIYLTLMCSTRLMGFTTCSLSCDIFCNVILIMIDLVALNNFWSGILRSRKNSFRQLCAAIWWTLTCWSISMTTACKPERRNSKETVWLCKQALTRRRIRLL